MPLNAIHVSAKCSCFKPCDTQLDRMLIAITMSIDFTLDMAFGSFVGEESGVPIVRQLVVFRDLCGSVSEPDSFYTSDRAGSHLK